MKIVVLVKQVPDTYGERLLDTDTGTLVRSGVDLVLDEVTERAIEVALRQKDADGSEVVLMTMGPASAADSLRKGLAIGADSAVHVTDDALAGSDLLRTSAVLAAALRREGFDVVLAGNESTDGRGGVLAAMLAERLSLPHATHLGSVSLSDGQVTGDRAGETVLRTVSAELPAVVSVTETNPEARFPTFKNSMRAKKKPIKTVPLADLDVEPAASGTVVLNSSRRPPRTAGVRVVDDGTAAHELAKFLKTSNLI